jgi:hypothetical protein
VCCHQNAQSFTFAVGAAANTIYNFLTATGLYATTFYLVHKSIQSIEFHQSTVIKVLVSGNVSSNVGTNLGKVLTRLKLFSPFALHVIPFHVATIFFAVAGYYPWLQRKAAYFQTASCCCASAVFAYFIFFSAPSKKSFLRGSTTRGEIDEETPTRADQSRISAKSHAPIYQHSHANSSIVLPTDTEEGTTDDVELK